MANRSRFHFDLVYEGKKQRYGDIILLQAGDLSCEADYNVGLHRQWGYEITYVVSGRGKCQIDGLQCDLVKGDVQYSHMSEIHNIMSDSKDPIRFFYIAFDLVPEQTGALGEMLQYLEKTPRRIVKERFDLYAKFTAIFGELIDNHPYSSTVLHHLIENIIIYTYRSFFLDQNHLYNPKAYKGSIAYDIMHYIDCNIEKVQKLSDVTAEFGYNYSYISRLFSKITGFSLKEYVETRKFSKAKDMLVGSDLSITDISEQLGFGSLHIFSRAFTRHCGISPSGYRKKAVISDVKKK